MISFGLAAAVTALLLARPGSASSSASSSAELADTSFGRLSVKTFGSRGRRLALALHDGTFSSGTDWHAVGPKLAATGYYVLCPDLYSLIGTRPGAAQNEELVSMIVQLQRWAGAEHVSLLLGNGWGGGLALRAAAMLPNYVERLALVAPFPHVGAPLVRDEDGEWMETVAPCESALFSNVNASFTPEVRPLLEREVVFEEAVGKEPARPEHFSEQLAVFAARPPVPKVSVPTACARVRAWRRWQDSGSAAYVRWQDGSPTGWAEPGDMREAEVRVARLASLIQDTEASCVAAGGGDENLLWRVRGLDGRFELTRADAKGAKDKSLFLHGLR